MSKPQAPLFPLSNVTLFPGTGAPLHIFEPRYRQMMQAALAADRVLVMATVRPEQAHEMAEAPPIYPLACAGFIQSHQELADGRFNLRLQGTQRVRILRELPATDDRLYRIGEFERLEETILDAAHCTRLRDRVTEHLTVLVREATGLALDHTMSGVASMDLATFTDSVCQTVDLPVQEKQALLEADSIDERLLRLEGTLEFHRALAQQAGTGSRPDTVH
ncbi:MAG: LON peptidase substrate-binding domain-containing protein [bacterium]|nr:LON peptidase substrate-binding domain-containing protein [bacterium]